MYDKNMSSFVTRKLAVKTASINTGLRQKLHTNLQNPTRSQMVMH